jgi:hypothetical protein
MMKATAKAVIVNEQWAKTYVSDHDGVVRWKSNDACPFADVLGDFLAFGYISQLSYDNTIVTRDIYEEEALEQLFNSKTTREQLFEMNANKF